MTGLFVIGIVVFGVKGISSPVISEVARISDPMVTSKNIVVGDVSVNAQNFGFEVYRDNWKTVVRSITSRRKKAKPFLSGFIIEIRLFAAAVVDFRDKLRLLGAGVFPVFTSFT